MPENPSRSSSANRMSVDIADLVSEKERPTTTTSNSLRETDAVRATKSEAALRERERELSQLVDMVPSHLWRLTPDGEPIFFNKRMVDFLGLDVADTDKPGMTGWRR